jgi:mRNA-degrading endonuclease toxin of MazEF toxin-antitoxin module
LSASAGEIWLADQGAETRRLVYIVSDTRFHRFAERAVVAPVLDGFPPAARPWHIRLSGDRAVAVHLLGTLPIERLLEPVESPGSETLRQVRRAVHAIAG